MEVFVVAKNVGKDAAADDPLVLVGQAPPVFSRGWQEGYADLDESSERSVLGAAVGSHGIEEPAAPGQATPTLVSRASRCQSQRPDPGTVYTATRFWASIWRRPPGGA